MTGSLQLPFLPTTALVVITVVLLSYALGYTIRKYKITFLAESGAVILLGCALSYPLYLYTNVTNTAIFDFNPNVFFFILLPPIIFESGYNIHERRFFANFQSILMYSIFGTVISAFVFGVIIWGASFSYGLLKSSTPFNLLECLMFGALISATDPVSTLSIFERVEVDPTLYSLVFGESVMNDAVAIVLYSTLDNHLGVEMNATTIGLAILQFFGIFIGSMVIGYVVGIATAFLFKNSKIGTHPTMEVMWIFLTGYFTYMIASICQTSGVVAIFFFGTTQRHYTWYNLSESGRVGAQVMFKGVAELAETCIFLFLGIFAALQQKGYEVNFILLCIAACLVSRAFNVFPLSFLLNCVRKNTSKVTIDMQVVLWNSGLRGAVAFSLALTFPAGTTISKLVAPTVYAIVLFTVIIIGGSTKPVIRLAGSLSTHDNEIFDSLGQFVDPETKPITRESEAMAAEKRKRQYLRSQRKPATGFVSKIKNFDKNYIVPRISRKYELIQDGVLPDHHVNPERQEYSSIGH